MIKIEELRIGSYLFKHGEVVKIVEIGIKHKGDTNYYLRSENDNCGYWIDQFKLIPLTEEILLKCGFTLRGVIFRINNGSSHQFDINYSPSRDIFYYDSSKYGIYTEVEIKYLHQLQNLYWCLCEKELEINNNTYIFKV